MKKITILTLVLSIVFLSNPVFASRPGFVDVTNRGGQTFSIPENAVEVSPNVWSLGVAYDKESDSFVDGYAIVHKKFSARSGSAKTPKSPTCYAFMASGAKWKTVEGWVVNTSNEEGLSSDFILSTLSSSIGQWEDAGDGVVGNNIAIDILGNGTVTGSTLVADEVATDNLNEVYFAPLDSGTIGVTIVWGNFGGPTFNRKLVEWDQIYNSDYEWTDDAVVNPAKMDFWNIAIHELGHSIGMSDIYNSSCSTVTMFGYGTEGEVQKRDLAPADILGVNTLY